jgi:hypothetical protein
MNVIMIGEENLYVHTPTVRLLLPIFCHLLTALLRFFSGSGGGM